MTAIAGFAVLPLAAPVEAIFGVRRSRCADFGLVTVVDLAVALLGVMLVLPAALVWAEGGFEPLSPSPPGGPGGALGTLIPARLRPGRG